MSNSPYIQGFTLIETMVAISILITAITGPMVLAASSIRATRDARNELIATHLAEEGVEVLHNIRDNNVTNYPVGSWMRDILPNCSGNGCVVDVTAQDPVYVWSAAAVIPCTAGCTNESQVFYNPNTGLYRQFSSPLGVPWVKTPFRRIISVVGVDDPTNPQQQVRILGTVTYLGFGGVLKTLTIDDDLYNWFPPLK